MRTLTKAEMEQVQRWAEETEFEKLLTFFESQDQTFFAPRPVIVGSIANEVVAIEGTLSRFMVLRLIVRKLDDPFNPLLDDGRVIRFPKSEANSYVRSAFYDAVTKTRKNSDVCLADGLLGKCSGPIVQAHTIQRAVIERHAVDGHVYQLDTIGKQHGPHLIQKVGINRTTTFPCFCAYHDAELFAPIERKPFAATPEQLHLYHVRAAAQSLYDRKHWSLGVRSELSKDTPVVLKDMQSTIEALLSDARDADREFRLSLHLLHKKDFSFLESRCWIGDVPPCIMASELFGPRNDFLGQQIQNPKGSPLAWVSLTITETRGRALVILTGRKACPIFAALVSSLEAVGMRGRTQAVASFTLCQLGNVILLPAWFDSLRPVDQRRISTAMRTQYFPRAHFPEIPNWNLRRLSPGALKP